MPQDEMLEAVKRYSTCGWVVHPLSPPDDTGKSPGKRPLLLAWQKLIKTPDDIGKYIQDGCNIGLVCGKASAVTIIDFDHDLFWESVTRDLGLLTLQALRTEGRGHCYFVYNPDLKSQKHHILGIEILNDGSNVVLPPSRHVSGETYAWVNPDAPLALMPLILLERLGLLFKAGANLTQQMSKTRPCFKKLWNGGKPDVLHGADGREVMLAWVTELKAKGAGTDEILTLARLVYKTEFSSKDTSQEWRNSKSKPWTCKKIKERLSSIISCADCPIEKKRGDDACEIRPVDIANKIYTNNRFITFIETGEVLYYKDGVYLQHAEAYIKIQALEIKPDITIHWMNEVVNNIKTRTYKNINTLDEQIENICLQNGVLNVKTRQLEEHSPEKKFLHKLPIIYDPNAKCPIIENFFSEVLSKDDIPKIEEFFGYCMYKDYFIQKAFMLLGEGNNGKSTLLRLLKMFLTPQAVASVSLQDIMNNHFAVANLHGKLANIYADLPSDALTQTGVLKMLTGGDQITAEKKFGGFFNFVNYAKLIFSANRLPYTYDDTDAFFRRWEIIGFPNSFEGEKEDTDLISKLTTREELSGLLNLALKGLNRLSTNKKFSGSKNINEIREQYVRLSDSVQAFALDCLEPSTDGFVIKKVLFSTYLEYCTIQKLLKVSEKTFFMRLPHHFRLNEFRPKLADGARATAFKGIVFKPNINGKTEENECKTITTSNLDNYCSKQPLTSVTDVNHVNNSLSLCKKNDYRKKTDMVRDISIDRDTKNKNIELESTIEKMVDIPDMVGQTTPKIDSGSVGSTIETDLQPLTSVTDVNHVNDSLLLFKRNDESENMRKIEQKGREWERMKGQSINSSKITEFCLWYCEHYLTQDTKPSEVRVIAEKIFKITPEPQTKSEIEYLSIRFLKDIPEFVGYDKMQYGAFKLGDTANIPSINAMALINRKAAVIIESAQ